MSSNYKKISNREVIQYAILKCLSESDSSLSGDDIMRYISDIKFPKNTPWTKSFYLSDFKILIMEPLYNLRNKHLIEGGWQEFKIKQSGRCRLTWLKQNHDYHKYWIPPWEQ